MCGSGTSRENSVMSAIADAMMANDAARSLGRSMATNQYTAMAHSMEPRYFDQNHGRWSGAYRTARPSGIITARTHRQTMLRGGLDFLRGM